jgi:hypothetical protein
MNYQYDQGQIVMWKWAGGQVSGRVEKRIENSISMIIKGSKITRHGSPEKPAYLVRSNAGNLALKLATELFLPESEKPLSRAQRPQSFGW